jgi:tryptophan synthase alpha chain
MTRIASVFAGRKDAALIAFITVGYPSLEATVEAVPLLEACGVDMVELGIPFSDPLADGITIQQASYQALQNGVTPSACLEAARLIRQRAGLPLLFMT